MVIMALGNGPGNVTTAVDFTIIGAVIKAVAGRAAGELGRKIHRHYFGCYTFIFFWVVVRVAIITTFVLLSNR